jgi:hypothetical protein
MKTLAATLLATTLPLLCGCGNYLSADYSRNDAVIQSLQKVSLIELPGVTLRSPGAGFSGGSAAKMARLELVFEIFSSDGKALPSDFADRIAQNIKNHLSSEGCTITGGGKGGGINYTDASGVKQANLGMASVRFSFRGSEGVADVLLIDRDYTADGKRVVGQLTITVTEAR